MAALEDLDEAIERCQRALREILNGNPEPNKMMFSHREDATLLNPVGSLAHGWDEVASTMERAALQVSGGEITSFETLEKYVTPELAYVVWVEHSRAKVGARKEIAPFDLRVTMIFRPEEGIWKVVHRHADPITTPRPIESVIEQ
jgi:ketosteroid isomerase-like protein